MQDYSKTSKFLSLILRHKPETIGISLDENGWAEVSEILEGINREGQRINMAILEEIVETNNKKRFCFNEDKTKIRANQGHSIEVDVELSPTTPPPVLYHGTADRFYESIARDGLQKRSRNHVHLSADTETAVNVGKRHGSPIVLKIDTEAMLTGGAVFYLSKNNIWLTDNVPAKFLEKIL